MTRPTYCSMSVHVDPQRQTIIQIAELHSSYIFKASFPLGHGSFYLGPGLARG
jgi:hypothetical protein